MAKLHPAPVMKLKTFGRLEKCPLESHEVIFVSVLFCAPTLSALSRRESGSKNIL